MAIVDYGALLRIDGKFVNKNCDLFMDDVNVIERADYRGEKIHVKGNYFVYAGDSHFMIAFYKTWCLVVSEGKILKYIDIQASSEKFYFGDDLPDIEVSFLDKTFYPLHAFELESWKEFVLETWTGTSGNEKLEELENGREMFKRYLKILKRYKRDEKKNRYRHRRFIAKWNYNGHHYEVIFGYGIDPDEKMQEKFSEVYKYSETEKNILKNWFGS